MEFYLQKIGILKKPITLRRTTNDPNYRKALLIYYDNFIKVKQIYRHFIEGSEMGPINVLGLIEKDSNQFLLVRHFYSLKIMIIKTFIF